MENYQSDEEIVLLNEKHIKKPFLVIREARCKVKKKERMYCKLILVTFTLNTKNCFSPDEIFALFCDSFETYKISDLKNVSALCFKVEPVSTKNKCVYTGLVNLKFQAYLWTLNCQNQFDTSKNIIFDVKFEPFKEYEKRNQHSYGKWKEENHTLGYSWTRSDNQDLELDQTSEIQNLSDKIRMEMMKPIKINLFRKKSPLVLEEIFDWKNAFIVLFLLIFEENFKKKYSNYTLGYQAYLENSWREKGWTFGKINIEYTSSKFVTGVLKENGDYGRKFANIKPLPGFRGNWIKLIRSSLQNLPKFIEAALAKKYYKDFDMALAHPTIISALKNIFPELKDHSTEQTTYYLKNRKKFLRKVQENYVYDEGKHIKKKGNLTATKTQGMHPTESEAKDFMTSIRYLRTPFSWQYQEGFTRVLSPCCRRITSILEHSSSSCDPKTKKAKPPCCAYKEVLTVHTLECHVTKDKPCCQGNWVEYFKAGFKKQKYEHQSECYRSRKTKCCEGSVHIFFHKKGCCVPKTIFSKRLPCCLEKEELLSDHSQDCSFHLEKSIFDQIKESEAIAKTLKENGYFPVAWHLAKMKSIIQRKKRERAPREDVILRKYFAYVIGGIENQILELAVDLCEQRNRKVLVFKFDGGLLRLQEGDTHESFQGLCEELSKVIFHELRIPIEFKIKEYSSDFEDFLTKEKIDVSKFRFFDDVVKDEKGFHWNEKQFKSVQALLAYFKESCYLNFENDNKINLNSEKDKRFNNSKNKSQKKMPNQSKDFGIIGGHQFIIEDEDQQRRDNEMRDNEMRALRNQVEKRDQEFEEVKQELQGIKNQLGELQELRGIKNQLGEMQGLLLKFLENKHSV